MSSITDEEVKEASLITSKYKKESRNKVNEENLGQLEFELKEDLREIADAFMGEIQTKSANFANVEKDALYYFEGKA